MKIVSLEKLGDPYIGIIENEDSYVSFIFSSQNGGYHEISVYPKSDYQSYRHFVAYICNYKSYGTCLMDPMGIESLSEQELMKIYKVIESL